MPRAVWATLIWAMAPLSPCLLGQEPGLLHPTEDVAVRNQIEAALEAEKALEKALGEVRVRRQELDERRQQRSGSDIKDLNESVRIVNGVSTVGFQGVGALLEGAVAETAESWCSGTLVGCRTFLTANHCFSGGRDPKRYHVFFQNLGFMEVQSISPAHEAYRFPHADLAVVRLARAAANLPISTINRSEIIPAGSAGTIVGYGRAGGIRFDPGVKRFGAVKTAACDRPETSLLCWDFHAPVGLPGTDSNTCNVDSGGPLFVNSAIDPKRRLLAGVTSGGAHDDCLAGDHSYDVDVRQFADWIASHAGSDLGESRCGGKASVEEPAVTVLADGGSLRIGESRDFRFKVPASVQSVVVALNGTDNRGANFNLFVKQGSLATVALNDCGRDAAGNYAACEFATPASGDWYVHVDQQGTLGGEFQLVVTLSP